MTSRDPKFELVQKTIFRYNTNKFPVRSKIDYHPFKQYLLNHPEKAHKYQSKKCVMGCEEIEDLKHLSTCPLIKLNNKAAARLINKSKEMNTLKIPAKLITLHEILKGNLNDTLKNG